MAKRAFCVLVMAALALFVSISTAEQVYLCQKGASTPVYTHDPGAAKAPCRLHKQGGRGALSVAPFPVPEVGDRVRDLLREKTRRSEEAAETAEILSGEAKALVRDYRAAVEDRSRTMLVLKRTRSYGWIRQIKEEKGDLLVRVERSALKSEDAKDIEALLAEIPP